MKPGDKVICTDPRLRYCNREATVIDTDNHSYIRIAWSDGIKSGTCWNSNPNMYFKIKAPCQKLSKQELIDGILKDV